MGDQTLTTLPDDLYGPGALVVIDIETGSALDKMFEQISVMPTLTN